VLEDAGFAAAERYEGHDRVAAGNVIGTVPAAGTALARGEPLTLLVSAGPPPVVVPGLVGRLESEARAALSAVGLTAGPSERVTTTLREVCLDCVVELRPAPGTAAPPGSSVTLVVRAPVPSPPPPPGRGHDRAAERGRDRDDGRGRGR
jgi:beta-lactam-binding protein with PASTA domain